MHMANMWKSLNIKDQDFCAWYIFCLFVCLFTLVSCRLSQCLSIWRPHTKTYNSSLLHSQEKHLCMVCVSVTVGLYVKRVLSKSREFHCTSRKSKLSEVWLLSLPALSVGPAVKGDFQVAFVMRLVLFTCKWTKIYI